MLVLSRKQGKKVNLKIKPVDMAELVKADECLSIDVVVVDIQPGKVRIGFAAPQCVEIFREELIPPGQTIRHELPDA